MVSAETRDVLWVIWERFGGTSRKKKLEAGKECEEGFRQRQHVQNPEIREIVMGETAAQSERKWWVVGSWNG